METTENSSLRRMVPKPIKSAARLVISLWKAGITLSVSTHKSRWKQVSQNPNPHWDWRNEIIAERVPDGSSVLDLGCGPQTLRRHLKKGCKYQPCDIIKSTPDVIFCDFNNGVYPEPGEMYDYVISSGVFEYIRQPREFLKRIMALGREIILSYSPLVPGQSKLHRLSVNWINHFTKEEVESLFTEAGLAWEVIYTHSQAETIYTLKAGPGPTAV
jgi:hypothetical protein